MSESTMSGAAEVAAAYDAVAPGYDGLVSEDHWMRRVLWGEYRRVFHPGEKVLDLGCGTGLDSVFLAGLGLEVTAVDVSPVMVDGLRRRLEGRPEAALVTPRVHGTAELAELEAGAYAGIVSAFAGLNTMDLEALAPQAARLLRPGGRLIAHVLAPAGLWPRLRLLARGRWRDAGALSRRRRLVVEIEGHRVEHRLAHWRRTLEPFLPAFTLRRRYALGFLWPQAAGRRLPLELATALGRLETRLGALPPFLGWGRFFVLDLERRP